MKNNLFNLLPIIIFAVAVSLLGFVWYQSTSMEESYIDKIKQDMIIRTKLLKPQTAKLLVGNAKQALQDYCSQADRETGTRVTVIRPDGEVACDSREAAARMDNHRNRQEIAAAFQQRTETSVRDSSTLGNRMIYAAMPVKVGNKTYVLRTAVSIKSIDSVIRQARRDIIIFILLGALITGAFSYSIVRSITRPVEDLKFNAARIAAGNLDIKLPIPGRGAIRDLALSLSNMAEQLKSRIDQITREKQEHDAIFASMSEGVIALDLTGGILDINRAARKILDLPKNAASGLSISDAVRNCELREFVEQVIHEKAPGEIDIALLGAQKRAIRARGAALTDNKGEIYGAVIVLLDYTRIKELENFRRDFIADVSHEIKTPLTVIRGAVETLQEGAIDEPENAAKFMSIITKHADRLNSLVADILSLSWLERRTQSEDRDFVVIKLSDPVATAVEFCREKAEDRNISLRFEISEDCQVEADCQLIEQAVINLIDNAVKYSGVKTHINVAVKAEGDNAIIQVSDNGCGIDSEHLPRLFERFYRVDRTRSRKLGGTGLGLAIVKHIAQLHKGSVRVDSEVGGGSAFTIRMPRYTIEAS